MSASVVTITETGEIEVTTPTTQVVEVVQAGPRGPAGPLGDWLGAVWIEGKPLTGEVVFETVPNEALILDADLAGWYVSARIEATDEVIVQVMVEDVEVGTITWQAADTVPVLATTGHDSVAVGALAHLSVVFPEPADDTLASISMRVRARRA